MSLRAWPLLLAGCAAAPSSAPPADPQVEHGDQAQSPPADADEPQPTASPKPGPKAIEVAEPEPRDDIAPPPFTARQIHDATAIGRTYRFRTKSKDQPANIIEIRFISVDQTGATTQISAFDETGKSVAPPTNKTATWAELVGHASYPKASTDLTSATIEVPAGSFECAVYAVTAMVGKDKRVTKSFFARELPGAPIMVIEQSAITGDVITKMELLEHTPGTASH